MQLPAWEGQATDEDRRATRDFIHSRAGGLFANCLAAVERAKAQLRSSPEFLSRALTAWHDAGVHPAQELGEDRDEWRKPRQRGTRGAPECG